MSKDSTFAQLMAEGIARQLVGGIIQEAFVTPADEYSDAGFGLVVKKGKSRSIVYVYSDPEGNGPGFLDIHTPAEHIKI